MSGEDAERELVSRAQAGSIAAFGTLVDAQQCALRAFLRRLCGAGRPPTTSPRRLS